jgi:hypothetical protein
MHAALDGILSTRVTILDELLPSITGGTGAHTRIHYRKLGDEQRPVQFAVLPASQFRRGLEDELRRLGFDGIAIHEPSDLEIAELADFHLAPEWVRWLMPCPTSGDAWIDGLPGSDARNQMRRKLRASSGVRVAAAPLTLSDYDSWHRQLFVPEILSKSGAIPAWPPVSGLANKLKLPLPAEPDGTVVPDMLRIFMYDESDRLIGGSLLTVGELDSTLRTRAAAYESHSRAGRELAVRGMHAMIGMGNALGIASLSYGDDPNLFGMDVTLGLARFKVSIGMRPVPSGIGGFQLIKVFCATAARLGADGLLCFGVPSRGAARIAACRRLGLLPRAQLTCQRQIESMQADVAGLQIGSEPTASAVRLPKGMPLVRFDRAGSAPRSVAV